MAPHRTELKQYFLTNLSPGVEELGLTRRPRDQSWERQRDGVRLAVHVNFGSLKGAVTAAVDLAIRSDEIEELEAKYKRSVPTEEAAAKVMTYTLGTWLGESLRDDEDRMLVSSREAADSAAASVVTNLRRNWLHFFGRFDSTQKIATLLVGPIEEAERFIPLEHLRARGAISAAAVLRSRSELDRIVAREMALMAELGEWHVDYVGGYAKWVATEAAVAWRD